MAFEKFNLFGKTALITGSAGLLGKEHAAALLEAGANLILTDLSLTNLTSMKNELLSAFSEAQIQIFKMDVSEIKDIIKISDEINLKGLRVDILINNAAINPKVEDVNWMREASRLENFSLENWGTQISVGLTGAFLCSRIFGSLMASDRKGGVILNIGSDLSVIAPDQRLYRKDGL